MKTIDITIELGKTKEEGNDIFGEGLTEEQINKIIDKVMSEPTFRRGKLDTNIEISDFRVDEGEIKVFLQGFDEVGKEPDGDDDVWYEKEYIYQLSDF